MSAMGLNGAIGAKAREGEIGQAETQELETLESQRKVAVARVNAARTEYLEASGELLRIDQQIIRAQQSAMEAAITAARTITRSEVEDAIRDASTAIRAGAAIVSETGTSASWGLELEKPMSIAREQAGPGEIPAVITVRALDQLGRFRAPGVLLTLDLSGRMPEPESVMTSAELAKRNRSR